MSHVAIGEIWIDKANLGQTKVVEKTLDDTQLGPKQVLLKVDSFGFSANNITYALFGDKMGYWGFFQADQGWGKLPIWGFAEVVASNHADIQVGEKVFGYLPMATHLLITAGEVNEQGFYDVDPGRKSISPVYDHYVRCATDPGYQADKEDWQLNYRPLFMTSFVLDDYVGETMSAQTRQVVLTSASSKTAYGAAYLLMQHKAVRGQDYQVVGLTSERNKDFVEKLACYDKVVGYDELQQLESSGQTVVLDFAGNKGLLLDIVQLLGAEATRLIFIGATDVEAQADKQEGQVDGELFFAPSQVKKRTKEWGGKGFLLKYAQGWQGFSSHIENMIQTREYQGMAQVQQLYLDGLAGRFEVDEMSVVRF